MIMTIQSTIDLLFGDVFRCYAVVQVYVTDTVGWSSVIGRRVKFLRAALSTV